MSSTKAIQRVLKRLQETDDFGYTPLSGDEQDELVLLLESALSESAAQERDMAVEGLREVVARYQGNPTDGLAMAILGRDWLYRLSPEPSPTGNKESK